MPFVCVITCVWQLWCRSSVPIGSNPVSWMIFFYLLTINWKQSHNSLCFTDITLTTKQNINLCGQDVCCCTLTCCNSTRKTLTGPGRHGTDEGGDGRPHGSDGDLVGGAFGAEGTRLKNLGAVSPVSFLDTTGTSWGRAGRPLQSYRNHGWGKRAKYWKWISRKRNWKYHFFF